MNLRSRRGVALVLVLWIIVILGGVSAGVVRSARTSTGIAATARAELIARAAAESGIEAFVAAIEDTLASFADSDDRKDWLNALSLSARNTLRASGRAQCDQPFGAMATRCVSWTV